MEVEVKVRLPDSTSHQKLSTLLSPFHTKTLLQENVFFDGSDSQLSSNLAVLRLRFITTTATATAPNHCVLSLKAQPVISQGISRAQELEEPMDPTLGRACIAEPWRLLSVTDSAIVERVKQEFGVSGLVCLGGFRNVRSVYDWQGLKIEVDETNFDFGTCYEVECETGDPERDKKVIERFLEDNGIGFEYSQVSKFAVFWSGKLPLS
uniref:CYTH domain-containing protein n=1 Tax=Quercus lobata TaxID=97700 RepID=A0A7N2LNC0_QUELO